MDTAAGVLEGLLEVLVAVPSSADLAEPPLRGLKRRTPSQSQQKETISK